MAELVLHPHTRAQVELYVNNPTHALLLTGPKGSGKQALATYMAARLLHKDDDALKVYPHYLVIAPEDGKAIPIEAIRKLQHFTTLKIPGAKGIRRVIIIDSAQMLTTEAQNALLKMLEEPPLNTVFLLTAAAADALLPTIQSRTRYMPVVPPGIDTLRSHYEKSFSAEEISKALLVSGGLPGLTYALLTSPESHPLYEATIQARTLLQSNAYERLLLVDSLSKQKQLCQDIVLILSQMARMAIGRNHGAASHRWQNILKAAFAAEANLRRNTQPKLVLMQLMLEI